MPTHGFKDHTGFKTNRLTRLIDATALDRFAQTLPHDVDCPVHGHLARLRLTYRRMAKRLALLEIEAFSEEYRRLYVR